MGQGDPSGEHQAGMSAPDIPYLPFREWGVPGRTDEVIE
jgi:hypothetical protein